MFKKLKIKFIAVATGAVVAVLTVIMTAVNAVNYYKVGEYADRIVSALIANDGEFSSTPAPEQTDERTDRPPEMPERRPVDGFSAETPYETRFFTVKYDGNEATAYTEHIFSIDENEAIAIADEIKKNNKKKGYYGVYRFAVSEDGNTVVFVNCNRQLETANNFLYASVLISLGGIFVVFVLVVVLSKKILRPVAESYERQKRFITDASHELKTPLTIISANNEISEIENGETESTRAISKQVVKMAAMVKNLTSLARLDEMNGEIKKSTFSLSELTAEAENAFGPAITARGKRAEFSHDDGATLSGDESLIRQLLSVLYENAAKYSLSFVKSELKKTGNKAIFTITNDAENEKAGEKNECFDRFYRSSDSRGSTTDGSGIGLSIAKEIADLHKATIRAYSEKDGEFTVKVVFPSA